jgi:hypothetical protein
VEMEVRRLAALLRRIKSEKVDAPAQLVEL